MADVDLQIVREFFEINHFLVTTRWPQHDPQSAGEGGVQLYVRNAGVHVADAAETVLHPAQIRRLQNAVVEIRPWHTDRFYASLVDANPVLTQFAEDGALAHAEDFFGGEPFATVLIISELPKSTEQRTQAVRRIEQAGVGHVIEFPALLQDLIDRVYLTGTYSGSHVLQVLQLLKRYRLVRTQQLEFAFPRDPAAYSRTTPVETSAPPPDGE